jgi:hypothetical protein
MYPDLDVLRSASELIKQHGDEAGLVAALLADALLERGAWRANGCGCGLRTRLMTCRW